MITSGSVAAGALGVVSLEEAAFRSVLSYVSSLVSRMNEGKAVLDVMEQRRVRVVTAKKEKISQDKSRCSKSCGQAVRVNVELCVTH